MAITSGKRVGRFILSGDTWHFLAQPVIVRYSCLRGDLS